MDLEIIDTTFRRFEYVSGALLLRSWKSKIMGLGPWRNRVAWPLPWLTVKNELKIFGFQFTPMYKKTTERCWEECYKGFNGVLMSWSSRQLETLVQRVEVLRDLPPVRYGLKLQQFHCLLSLLRNLSQPYFFFCGLENLRN